MSETYNQLLAMIETVARALGDDLSIRLLTPPYFIATKLDAWQGRGNNDAFHRDLEDLLNLFDGRPSLVEELSTAPEELQAFVAEEISKLLGLQDFEYAVQSTARGDEQREEIIFERLEAILFMGKGSEHKGSSPSQ